MIAALPGQVIGGIASVTSLGKMAQGTAAVKPANLSQVHPRVRLLQPPSVVCPHCSC